MKSNVIQKLDPEELIGQMRTEKKIIQRITRLKKNKKSVLRRLEKSVPTKLPKSSNYEQQQVRVKKNTGKI